MDTQKKLINIHTGSIDTIEGWRGDYETALKNGDTTDTWEVWSHCLQEVKRLKLIVSNGQGASEDRVVDSVTSGMALFESEWSDPQNLRAKILELEHGKEMSGIVLASKDFDGEWIVNDK